jgi:peptide/nickel transport system substrate-binding protein
MKKIASALLVCGLAAVFAAGCGGGGTASPASAPARTDPQLKEAPQLAEKVAKGELPPLEQRLPETPFVSSAPEIGMYGGIYRAAGMGPAHGQVETEYVRATGLVRLLPDLQTMVPFVLESYEANSDFTVWDLKLRKGMKWSDGAPFTTGDFKFWYEDVLQNQDLTPAILQRWTPGGQLMKIEFLDDVSMRITFAASYPAFDVTMMQTVEYNNTMWAPKHYLQKWHLAYNADADTLAKSEGYETWVQAFSDHRDKNAGHTDVNCPDITPWVLSGIDAQSNKYFDRNPYYFVVDREGRQLPYMDQQISVTMQDVQARILMLKNGELHAAGEHPLPVSEYTSYKEGESPNSYTLYMFENTRGSDCAYTFNINHKDPVLRRIFSDVKFREAMSLAINRQQINDVLYFGRAVARQALPPPGTSFMEDWMPDYMIDYNVDEANKRLDEIGLRWNPGRTQRLRPDGQPLSIIVESIEEFAPMSEMVAEMWTAVGVKTTFKLVERTYANSHFYDNERDAQCWTFDGVAEIALRGSSGGTINPPWRRDAGGFATLYANWFDTNGREGEEPTAEIRRLREIIDEWQTLSPRDPRYNELGKEYLSIHTRNLWYIGLTVVPRIVMISNKLGNTPAEGSFAYDYRYWYPYRGDSWYFK